MIPYKPRTFATEEDRKADYLDRVGPLIIPRTNTTERPDPDMTLGQWLDWLRDDNEKRWTHGMKRE